MQPKEQCHIYCPTVEWEIYRAGREVHDETDKPAQARADRADRSMTGIKTREEAEEEKGRHPSCSSPLRL